MTEHLRVPVLWGRIRQAVDFHTEVYDAEGRAWRREPKPALWDTLYRWEGPDRPYTWTPNRDDTVWVGPAPIPEPEDGTRIEFQHNTDVYGAWRDDASSAAAGWSSGNGGEVWCLYGMTVPMTWTAMWVLFGNSLYQAQTMTPGPTLAEIQEAMA